MCCDMPFYHFVHHESDCADREECVKKFKRQDTFLGVWLINGASSGVHSEGAEVQARAYCFIGVATDFARE